jgi:NADH:ubiquinone oxidoreductase subunit 3 (subunit A)
MVTKKQFQTEYAKFLREHGELYEETKLPMTQADRKKAKQFYWVILFFVVLFSIIGGINVYFSSSKGITPSLVTFFTVAAVIVGGFYYSIVNTLRLDKKAVIKTVVTGKRNRKGYELEINGRKHIHVSQDNYDTLNFGDIIQVTQVGSIITLAQTITKLGSIFDNDPI